jgi:ABC-type phosphate/phosphonate transport system substrate-binding protein
MPPLEIHSEPPSMTVGPDARSAKARVRAGGIGLACCTLLLATRLLDGDVASAADSPDAATPLALNVGFVRSCFLGVNRTDAEGAFKALAESIGRKHGYRAATQTRIFETAPEIEAAVKSGSVNLAIVDSWKYLAMDHGGHYMTPCFVTLEQGSVAKKYLLLTRRDSQLNTLADLRGKDIVELEIANGNAGKFWLDTLLLAEHPNGRADFFGEVTLAGKSALAVLPVFFGKKPVCFVDQPAFDLMRELNPQVGKDLQVVASSDPYLENVLCLGTAGWLSDKARADFIETLAELHREPAGQQILTLFKVNQLVPFQEAQLDSVKKLRARYEALLKATQ